jgi:hypothetical protein
MPPNQQTIRIEPLAPHKPVLGAPCNGCGVCCLAEPCPLGMVLSRQRTGACTALRWNAAATQYRCGVLVDTHAVVRQALPVWLGFLRAPAAAVLHRLGRRWIAAGMGCDSTLELVLPQRTTMQSESTTPP